MTFIPIYWHTESFMDLHSQGGQRVEPAQHKVATKDETFAQMSTIWPCLSVSGNVESVV